MKMKLRFVSSRRGSVLMVTLMTTVIIGIALASFLKLTRAQNRSTYRSQTWNAAIPVVEAGIEEALAHLNNNCLSNGINIGVVNWTADGWTAIAGGYSKTNTLPGNTYYVAAIYTTNAQGPDIYARGYVEAPVNLSQADGTLFAASGNSSANGYVSRGVHVTAVKDAIFSKGMVAKGDIGWVGNIWSDSFDSQDPSYSTSGQYDVTKRKDNGSVASVTGIITMGGGVIYGSVGTGPSGSASGGTVGDLAWITSGGTGIESGHYANDMNVAFPDVQVPFVGGYSTPGPGSASVTNYTYGTAQITSSTYPSPTPAGGVVTNR